MNIYLYNLLNRSIFNKKKEKKIEYTIIQIQSNKECLFVVVSSKHTVLFATYVFLNIFGFVDVIQYDDSVTHHKLFL